MVYPDIIFGRQLIYQQGVSKARDCSKNQSFFNIIRKEVEEPIFECLGIPSISVIESILAHPQTKAMQIIVNLAELFYQACELYGYQEYDSCVHSTPDMFDDSINQFMYLFKSKLNLYDGQQVIIDSNLNIYIPEDVINILSGDVLACCCFYKVVGQNPALLLMRDRATNLNLRASDMYKDQLDSNLIVFIIQCDVLGITLNEVFGLDHDVDLFSDCNLVVVPDNSFTLCDVYWMGDSSNSFPMVNGINYTKLKQKTREGQLDNLEVIDGHFLINGMDITKVLNS